MISQIYCGQESRQSDITHTFYKDYNLNIERNHTILVVHYTQYNYGLFYFLYNNIKYGTQVSK